jgi:hypothetical protein
MWTLILLNGNSDEDGMIKFYNESPASLTIIFDLFYSMICLVSKYALPLQQFQPGCVEICDGSDCRRESLNELSKTAATCQWITSVQSLSDDLSNHRFYADSTVPAEG